MLVKDETGTATIGELSPGERLSYLAHEWITPEPGPGILTEPGSRLFVNTRTGATKFFSDHLPLVKIGKGSNGKDHVWEFRELPCLVSDIVNRAREVFGFCELSTSTVGKIVATIHQLKRLARDVPKGSDAERTVKNWIKELQLRELEML